MSMEAIGEMGCPNVAIMEEMYQRYCEDPFSVPSSWQQWFRSLELEPEPAVAPRAAAPETSRTTTPERPSPQPAAQGGPSEVRVFQLIHAYRTYGHLLAEVNPVATKSSLQEVNQLNLQHLGFSEEELHQPFPTCGLLEQEQAPLNEIIGVLKEIYCRQIGVEYMDLQKPDLERWLQQQIEPNRFHKELSIEEKQGILQQLNKSELFEVFLHTKFVGQKRFSLEGGETLLPVLNALIETGAEEGVTDCLIGMAHRGRLNVLTNILQKSYSEIFSEFEEHYVPDSFEGSGDVKYHKGFSSDIVTTSGKKVHVLLAANPSHLEAVNAVVTGMARAKQVMKGDDIEMRRVIPILIHGDAAISGQGIVYECMQMVKIPGYGTGGTIHIIVNNQIGFTTLPKDSRSTRYCSDIARSFGAPVFHVNAEDPEGCVYATKLAVALRQKFHVDVFIELNCYRKYGHNEGDEPAFTQPLEYQLIKKKKPIREIYRDNLIHQGVLEKHVAETLEGDFKNSLQQALQGTSEETVGERQEKKVPRCDEGRSGSSDIEAELFKPINTSVPLETLQEVAQHFCTVPQGFQLHRKLERLLKQRMQMVHNDPHVPGIDWGMAEHLAFGTLLWEGIHVRVSGQDSRRGTFSHRHAMWVDQMNAKKFFPLSRLKANQGRFDVFNSLLSEYAVLGFEFGYSTAHLDALTIWEAQFGDFCNGAQIIIDQFISTAEQKWNKKCNLVMLLPHGFEGQGPEHSSARMERFLQLAGDYNMQIANCTLPGQFFHLLRRQVLRKLYKPLIVFTPKGLLRFPACVSSLNDLTDARFEEILDDPEPPEQCQRLLICSGRVYYDLIERRNELEERGTAILRVEQLYPLHKLKLKALIDKYSGFKSCCWVQEEPNNMGAWDYMRPNLRELLPGRIDPIYVGRQRSASPAVGSHALHKKELQQLLKDAFEKNGPRATATV